MHLLIGFLSTILCLQYLSSYKNNYLNKNKNVFISQPEALLKKIQCTSVCDGEIYLSYFGYTDSESMKRCYQQCTSLQIYFI